jgi:putative iron-regulated protein
VLATYADIAHATYEDSLIAARELQAAVGALLAEPGEATHQAAKDAWRAARVPYQQSEAYRFGNPLVDDWEGRVNAWPLDEGLIDYVAGAYGTESDDNPYYVANVIANPTLTSGGETIDASTIDQDLISSLQEIDEVEANVATGYHAIEFLLWGQDLNGTGPGAGARP